MGDGGSDPFEAEGTIGIEEEFFLVDEDGRPLGGTDELCYAHDPPEILTDRLDHELFTFVIETQTPVIADLASAPATLSAVRDALVGYAADHGYRVAAAGLHPTANWRDLEHVSKPRYRRQLDRIQYPQHRNTTAGLHVHVGVGDGDRAVWVADEIRWYLPLILALSANSPYWCGFDTGLASARACVFESLPNTGMPAAYGTLDRYADIEAAMLETGSISDRGEIWYDVRPHTAYGTVEVRTPDAQRDEWRVLALVEYVHRLVETLAEAHRRLADGADREVVLADAHAPWAD
ncbi:MAG: glutamate--cysteine ligase, partial [Halobacteriales archaeon]